MVVGHIPGRSEPWSLTAMVGHSSRTTAAQGWPQLKDDHTRERPQFMDDHSHRRGDRQHGRYPAKDWGTDDTPTVDGTQPETGNCKDNTPSVNDTQPETGNWEKNTLSVTLLALESLAKLKIPPRKDRTMGILLDGALVSEVAEEAPRACVRMSTVYRAQESSLGSIRLISVTQRGSDCCLPMGPSRSHGPPAPFVACTNILRLVLTDFRIEQGVWLQSLSLPFLFEFPSHAHKHSLFSQRLFMGLYPQVKHEKPSVTPDDSKGLCTHPQEDRYKTASSRNVLESNLSC
ncbi:hypothetical protein N0V90_012820 [Kalmusia sp. IMI 367209]|nr:hypothetical protein N0V90_012820 [Kalmusia sp. IMI 367209]